MTGRGLHPLPVMNNKLSVKDSEAFIQKFVDAGWKHEVETTEYPYYASTVHTLSFSLVAWYGSLVWFTVFVSVYSPKFLTSGRASVKVWSISHYAPKSIKGTWNAGYYLKQSQDETAALAQKKAEREAKLAAA